MIVEERSHTDPLDLQTELKRLAIRNPAGFVERAAILCPLLKSAQRKHSYYASWGFFEVNSTINVLNGLLVDAKAAVKAGQQLDRERRAAEKEARKDEPRNSLLAEPLPEQLDLFADQRRWPKRPYCATELEEGLRIRTMKSAILRPYVQANPPHLRVWSLFDIDRHGGGIAWEDAGLPPPTWATINRENGHAHLAWGLSVPVLVESPEMRQGPLRYLTGIESMMREGLRADPGFGGLITKNPAHPLWRTLRGPRMTYDLGELAEYLPGLEQHIPKRANHIEEVGLGRNCSLFETLRHWAYKNVRPYRMEGRQGWAAWVSKANSTALGMNGEFRYPLDGKEVWHIAKSVAKWTFNRFDLERSDAKFSAKQAARGKQGGRPGLGEPWNALGISRATYFRRVKSGLIVPAHVVDN